MSADVPETVVRLRGVSKHYGSTTAVRDLDLEVHAAEVLALLGPNGAGKTTTVEMCEGFVRPDAGARPGPDRRQRPAAAADRGDAVLDTLGACALVGRPELVFLDEPTAGMDAHARLLVWELIDALRRDGVTVVLTTHQLKEAEELADRLVIIDHGATVAAGTPAELMRSGAKDQLRFSAPPRLDLSLLSAALPEDYKATELTPGEYLVEGPVDPQVLATVTAWCARIDVLATDMRVEQRSLEDVFLDLTGRKLRQ